MWGGAGGGCHPPSLDSPSVAAPSHMLPAPEEGMKLGMQLCLCQLIKQS